MLVGLEPGPPPWVLWMRVVGMAVSSMAAGP